MPRPGSIGSLRPRLQFPTCSPQVPTIAGKKRGKTLAPGICAEVKAVHITHTQALHRAYVHRLHQPAYLPAGETGVEFAAKAAKSGISGPARTPRTSSLRLFLFRQLVAIRL